MYKKIKHYVLQIKYLSKLNILFYNVSFILTHFLVGFIYDTKKEQIKYIAV